MNQKQNEQLMLEIIGFLVKIASQCPIGLIEAREEIEELYKYYKQIEEYKKTLKNDTR